MHEVGATLPSLIHKHQAAEHLGRVLTIHSLFLILCSPSRTWADRNGSTNCWQSVFATIPPKRSCHSQFDFFFTTPLTHTVRTHTQVKRAAAEGLRIVDKCAQDPPLQVGNEVFEPSFSALGAQSNGKGRRTAMTEEERTAALCQVGK